MIKVAVGVPCNDNVNIMFTVSLLNMFLQSAMKGIQCLLIVQQSSIVEWGRHTIVQQAIKHEADYLLFLDSDMVFPADTLTELLKHEKSIVCCDACRRRPPYTTVVKDLNGKPIDHSKAKGLVQIAGMSPAVALIKTKVLKKIEEPCFKVPWNKTKKNFLGEDYYFSAKAIKKGFDIWCDTDLSKKIGHIGCETIYIDAKGDNNEDKNN